MRSSQVILTAADQKFEKQLATYQETGRQLVHSMRTCLMDAVKQLVRVAKLYQEDPSLAKLVEGLMQGLYEQDIIPVARAVDDYVSRTDRSRMDFATPSPETLFIAAVLSVQDAINHWSSGRTDDLAAAHSDTVRARASLNKLEMWK